MLTKEIQNERKSGMRLLENEIPFFFIILNRAGKVMDDVHLDEIEARLVV